jgi:hypothetical protein
VASPFAATCQIGPTLSGNTTGAFYFPGGQQLCLTYVDLLQGDSSKTYVWVSSDPNNYFTPLGNNDEVVFAAGPQDPMYWKIQLSSGVSLNFYIGTATLPQPHMTVRSLPRA